MTLPRLSILVPLLLVPLLVRASDEVAVSADPLRDAVEAAMVRDRLPGVAVAVVRDGRLVRAEGYGIANLELGVPVRPATVFKIASMSKQFCAAVILQLADEGRLHLEDRIRRHIPDAPESWETVKIRHLLSHTSGIRNCTDLSEFSFRTEYTREAFLRMMSAHPLDFEPGSRYSYSNSGYAVLTMLVRAICGRPLAEEVKDRILRPAGMEATSYFRYQELVPNRANGYTWSNGAFQNMLGLRPELLDGSGGMLTNVLDLAKWDAALAGERPLPQAIKSLMWTPHRLNDGKEHGYGFGWNLGTFQGKRRISHTGSTQGFTSAILRLPEDRLTVIVLRNSTGGSSLTMAQEIASMVLDGRIEG
jgi:D-alanyl-D-alanine carboxypeptidase